MFAELGCKSAGWAWRVTDAFKFAQGHRFDIAILDIGIGEELIAPFAEELAVRRKPFVFVTGMGRTAVPDGLRGRPFVKKLFDAVDLRRAMLSALGAGAAPPTGR